MLNDFKAYRLAVSFHQVCRKQRLPSFFFEQLARASASIALNLAEGSGRRGSADQKRFYAIAFGSLKECEAIFEMQEVSDPIARELLSQLGAILFVLSKPEQRQRVEPDDTGEGLLH